MNYSTDRVFQVIQQICSPDTLVPILIQAWNYWLGEQPQMIKVQPTLTYYRPFDQARIVAQVEVILDEGTEPISLHLFFHVFAEAAAARQQLEQGYEKAIPPKAALPIFLIAEWKTVVWSLPHAPSLNELTDLLQPEYFCQLLIAPEDLPDAIEDYPSPQLFRYVPFKRAILTWQSSCTERRYFIKLCTEAEFLRVVRNFQQIHAAAKYLNFVVPQPVAFDSASRTFSMIALAGEQFTSIMRQIQPEPFAQVGRVLAQLHHVDLNPETVWTPQKELRTLCKAMDEVKLALPHLGILIDHVFARLMDTIAQMEFRANHPIHANLFGDQILYSPNQIGLVDWDTLSLGDPLYDIGRLIAHFIYLAGCERLAPSAVRICVEALLQGYEQGIHWQIDRSCLIWHITAQLLLRGKISSLRKLPFGWQDHLEFVVTEAEWLLSGCSEYVSLPALTEPILIA